MRSGSKRSDKVEQVYSYGLYSYGLRTYGLCSHGKHNGLCSYGKRTDKVEQVSLALPMRQAHPVFFSLQLSLSLIDGAAARTEMTAAAAAAAGTVRGPRFFFSGFRRTQRSPERQHYLTPAPARPANCLHGHGLYSHGPYIYGIYSYGLYIYGPYSYGQLAYARRIAAARATCAL